MGRLDLRDTYRDEDYEFGPSRPRKGWSFPPLTAGARQLTVDDCIAVAEIGSDAWIAQEIAAGRSGEERDKLGGDVRNPASRQVRTPPAKSGRDPAHGQRGRSVTGTPLGVGVVGARCPHV